MAAAGDRSSETCRPIGFHNPGRNRSNLESGRTTVSAPEKLPCELRFLAAVTLKQPLLPSGRNFLALNEPTHIIARNPIEISMKTNVPRTWLGAVLVALVAAFFITVTAWLIASPSEEISKAVSASGASSARQASPDQFLNAVASVLVDVDRKNASPYVTAAVQARPDLKDQILATVAEVNRGDTQGDGADSHVSQHRRRCTICHQGHTLTLPCHAAREHLEHHPGDTRGPCPPTPPPHY